MAQCEGSATVMYYKQYMLMLDFKELGLLRTNIYFIVPLEVIVSISRSGLKPGRLRPLRSLPSRDLSGS